MLALVLTMVLEIRHHLQALGSLDPEEVGLGAVLLAAAVAEFPFLSTHKTLGPEDEQVCTIVVDRCSHSDAGHRSILQNVAHQTCR